METPFPIRKRQSGSAHSVPPSSSTTLEHADSGRLSKKYKPPHQILNLTPPKQTIPTFTTLQPKYWTILPIPIFTRPLSLLNLTWHLHNPSPSPMIISMLLSRSSPASAFLGAHFNDVEQMMDGGEILLRTKFDLDYHEERYEYLTETVLEPVESVDVTC